MYLYTCSVPFPNRILSDQWYKYCRQINKSQNCRVQFSNLAKMLYWRAVFSCMFNHLSCRQQLQLAIWYLDQSVLVQVRKSCKTPLQNADNLGWKRGSLKVLKHYDSRFCSKIDHFAFGQICPTVTSKYWLAPPPPLNDQWTLIGKQVNVSTAIWITLSSWPLETGIFLRLCLSYAVK